MHRRAWPTRHKAGSLQPPSPLASRGAPVLSAPRAERGYMHCRAAAQVAYESTHVPQGCGRRRTGGGSSRRPSGRTPPRTWPPRTRPPPSSCPRRAPSWSATTNAAVLIFRGVRRTPPDRTSSPPPLLPPLACLLPAEAHEQAGGATSRPSMMSAQMSSLRDRPVWHPNADVLLAWHMLTFEPVIGSVATTCNNAWECPVAWW